MAQTAEIRPIAIDPFDREFLADPYVHHAALRDAGPVVWLEAIGCFGMARYTEVREALTDWETYSSARGVGLADFAREKPFRTPSLLLERDPPEHRLNRTVMDRIVAIPRLRAQAGRWREVAASLVDPLAARGEFDAVTELAELFPLAIFPDLLGLPDEGRHHLLKYATAVFNAFGPQNDILREGNEGLEPALEWIAAACKRANLKPGGWAMAVHEAIADEGRPESDAELLVRSFLSAGVDTTINGIGNMIHAFARHPDQWAALRANPILQKKAFEEALRWDGTAQTFFRTTTRDVAVDGVTIPRDSKLLLFLAAANRDPRRWEDADRFDITRAASGHVGFGYGIHQCLGQMIARQEAEIMLSAMVERFASIRLAGAPVRRINNTLRALASLPVRIEQA